MPVSGRTRRTDRDAFYRDEVYLRLLARVRANLRRFRAEKGWTQEAAAARCGMTHATYHPIESGKTNLTFVTLARLARGFDVDPRDIVAPLRGAKRAPP